MNIINKTSEPLSVPLPGGKRLHLGPGKTGQVTPKALDHPPLVRLIESGEIAKAAEGPKRRGAAGGRAAGPGHGARHGGPGAMPQFGDR